MNTEKNDFLLLPAPTNGPTNIEVKIILFVGICIISRSSFVLEPGKEVSKFIISLSSLDSLNGRVSFFCHFAQSIPRYIEGDHKSDGCQNEEARENSKCNPFPFVIARLK